MLSWLRLLLLASTLALLAHAASPVGLDAQSFGPLQDAQCNMETVDAAKYARRTAVATNSLYTSTTKKRTADTPFPRVAYCRRSAQQLHSVLSDLSETPFFRLINVNMDGKCQYWGGPEADEPACESRAEPSAPPLCSLGTDAPSDPFGAPADPFGAPADPFGSSSTSSSISALDAYVSAALDPPTRPRAARPMSKCIDCSWPTARSSHRLPPCRTCPCALAPRADLSLRTWLLQDYHARGGPCPRPRGGGAAGLLERGAAHLLARHVLQHPNERVRLCQLEGESRV